VRANYIDLDEAETVYPNNRRADSILILPRSFQRMAALKTRFHGPLPETINDAS
jgi:hypothetical protein